MDFSLSNKYNKITLTAAIIYLSDKINNLNRFNMKNLLEEMNIAQIEFRDCLSQLIGVYRQYVDSA